MSNPESGPAADGAVALAHWGLVRATGADAASFLHGQLTNDVLGLGDAVRLAGYCSAKGRLQASFLLWQQAPDQILLACDTALAAPTAKRLSMFVLRAKCRIEAPAADAVQAVGLLGATARAALTAAGLDGAEPLAASPVPPLGRQRTLDGGSLLRLPAVDGIARAVWLAAPGTPIPGIGAPPAASLAVWRALEVRSGLPWVEPATVDRFVPQMLNYELIGGIDFHKGCYPGQEVVARSQYRGTIKRRTLLFRAAPDAGCTPGAEVFHADDPGQPAGMVVNAAPDPLEGGVVALVEVKLAAIDDRPLHLGTAAGPTLARSVLPYALPLPVPAD